MPALTSQHAFGLHITDVAVKIAELAPTGETFQLIAFGKRLLPQTAVIDGAVNDPKLVAQEIGQLLYKPQMGRVSTNFVVCSLPESRVFLKTISLPRFPQKQLKEAILWEARSILPVPSDKAYYQEQILETTEKETTALVAATEKHLVDGYLEVLRLLNLTPIALDLECYATRRTIDDKELSGKLLIQVHIGSKVTTLTILRHGQVWFSHALNTGLIPITQEVADNLGISFKQAESKIGREGLQKNTFARSLKIISSGITSTVKFYHEQMEKKGGQVEAVIFTGGYSQIPGLVDNIGEKTPDLPHRIAKPLLTFALPEERTISPLNISIGLALRGAYPARWQEDLNFLPDSYILQASADKARAKMGLLLTVFSLIFLSVIFILASTVFYLYRQINQAKEAISSHQQLIQDHPAKNLLSWVEKTNIQLALLKDLEETRIPFDKIIGQIAQAVPEGVILDSLIFTDEGRKMRLAGISATRLHILAFIQNLGKVAFFSDIVVTWGSFNQPTNAPFTIEFTVDEKEL